MAYELTVNSDIQDKLYNEIKDMNDSLGGKTINYDQIQGMKYLDQVVCETLRKWGAPVSVSIRNVLNNIII